MLHSHKYPVCDIRFFPTACRLVSAVDSTRRSDIHMCRELQIYFSWPVTTYELDSRSRLIEIGDELQINTAAMYSIMLRNGVQTIATLLSSDLPIRIAGQDLSTQPAPQRQPVLSSRRRRASTARDFPADGIDPFSMPSAPLPPSLMPSQDMAWPGQRPLPSMDLPFSPYPDYYPQNMTPTRRRADSNMGDMYMRRT